MIGVEVILKVLKGRKKYWNAWNLFLLIINSLSASHLARLFWQILNILSPGSCSETREKASYVDSQENFGQF